MLFNGGVGGGTGKECIEYWCGVVSKECSSSNMLALPIFSIPNCAYKPKGHVVQYLVADQLEQIKDLAQFQCIRPCDRYVYELGLHISALSHTYIATSMDTPHDLHNIP